MRQWAALGSSSQQFAYCKQYDHWYLSWSQWCEKSRFINMSLLLILDNWIYKVKVKVNVNVKFSLEQATKAQRGVDIQRYSFFNLGPKMGVGGQGHALAALPTGKDPVPIVWEAGWIPEPVWTSAENLAPTGIRSPDRPARSESLYRLSYPGP